ncbi:MAG: hypothetical protein M3Y23_02460 [Actinomycetota bacterium]|nr:hypothetical protein [Actinomycetota bacterium]
MVDIGRTLPPRDAVYGATEPAGRGAPLAYQDFTLVFSGATVDGHRTTWRFEAEGEGESVPVSFVTGGVLDEARFQVAGKVFTLWLNAQADQLEVTVSLAEPNRA